MEGEGSGGAGCGGWDGMGWMGKGAEREENWRGGEGRERMRVVVVKGGE